MKRIRTVIAVLIAVVLAVLSALHVFWAAGGKTPSAAAIPEIAGRPVFQPSAFATLAVAVALACAAVVILARGGLALTALPSSLASWACGAVGAVFVLRALGEFRLVGFFKSVKGTQFAAMDTWIYSPLCLALGMGALWLAFAGHKERP